MDLGNVRRRLAIDAPLAAESSLITASFVWVAIYSYLTDPRHTDGFCEYYARTTLPYLVLLLGIPAFFVACRWIGFRVR